MSISIGTDSLYNETLNSLNKTNTLENSLSGRLKGSTDEELMEVCKSFESYLLEQVFKEMEATVEGRYRYRWSGNCSDALRINEKKSIDICVWGVLTRHPFYIIGK